MFRRNSFRGIIQTKVGIIVASLIFAFIHLRYWRHWFLIVNVVVLSFWIGLIYSLSGHLLLPVIAMHFTINFILGFYISKRISET
ncbi:type II CAAX prenyl endopeptidase Rce1 family protein [Bacillus sp. N9]